MKHETDGFSSCSCFEGYLEEQNMTLFKWASLAVRKQIEFYEKALKAKPCDKSQEWKDFLKLVQARTNALVARGVNPDVLSVVADKKLHNVDFKITREIQGTKLPKR